MCSYYDGFCPPNGLWQEASMGNAAKSQSIFEPMCGIMKGDGNALPIGRVCWPM